ncbi:exported hypothetical protein [Streptomyces misionensis JCM 4497]
MVCRRLSMCTLSACWLKTPFGPFALASVRVLASLPISMLLNAASPDISVESVVRSEAVTLLAPLPAVIRRLVPPRSTLWHSLDSVALLMAEVTTSTWPPVSPAFGLPSAMLSRPPNCSKPVPFSCSAVTVNGMPEMANCTPSAPCAVSTARPAATIVAGTAITAARRARTRPRLSPAGAAVLLGASEGEPLPGFSGVLPVDETSGDKAMSAPMGMDSMRVGLQWPDVLARTAAAADASPHSRRARGLSRYAAVAFRGSYRRLLFGVKGDVKKGC